MENRLSEEIYRMKSLVSYKKGNVISEQPLPPASTAGQLGGFPSFPAPPKPDPKPAPKTNTNPVKSKPTTGGLPPNPLEEKFLVNCDSNPVILDRPTASQQNDFARKSGLNPGTPENKQFFCSSKKMSEKLAEMSKSQKVEPKKQVPKLNWIPEKFPLKYMMQGENVKKLQQALDVRNKKGQPNITGKFYNATQFALDKKIQELGLKYDRNVGLDQATFNDIVNPRERKTEPAQVTGVERKKIEPVTAPTQITATTPQVNVQVPKQPVEPQTRRELRRNRRAARRA